MKSNADCPRCHQPSLKEYRLPHPLLLFWVLMPALAFNELVFGQRIPRRTLICRACPLMLGDRQYIPCPSCGTLNPAKRWAGRYAFGNWLGLVCPVCGERIPCLWNVTSLVLLLLTFPVWYLPYRYCFKSKPTVKPAVEAKVVASTTTAWFRMGLSFGIFMWLTLSVLPFLWNYLKQGRGDIQALVIDAILWFLGGMAFGLANRWLFSHKGGGSEPGPDP